MRWMLAILVLLLGAALVLLIDGRRSGPSSGLAPVPVPDASRPVLEVPETPRAASARASAPAADDECARCHRQRQPGLMDQWDASAHAKEGVSCADCHGTDHDAIFAAEGQVPSTACARCHERETREFHASAHASARSSALKNGRLLAQIPAMQRRGCLSCHDSAGGATGRCNACHGAHRHSAADARRPEACGVCHMGPDHPHIEAWEASLHGVVYGATKDVRQAPTCVTCHMDGGSHLVGRGITLGRSGSGAVLEGESAPIPMHTIARATAEKERKRMLGICERCHTPRVARRALEDADAIKREADRLVGVAVDLVRGLYDDALLDPMPAERPAHPTAGHALLLGGGALYENHSEAERLFFDLAKFGHAITFKAGYHQSPDWTHWLGMARLKSGLEALRAHDRRVRAAASRAGEGKPGK